MSYWPNFSSSATPLLPTDSSGNMQFPMWTPGAPLPPFPLMMDDVAHLQHVGYVTPEVINFMVSPGFPPQHEQQQQVCNNCSQTQAKAKDLETSLKTSETLLEEKKTELLNEQKSKEAKISILEETIRTLSRANDMLKQKNFDLQQSQAQLTEHNTNLHETLNEGISRCREIEADLKACLESGQRLNRDLASRKRLPQGSPESTPSKIAK